MDNKLILFINTIKYLKPSQGLYRVTNRVKRELYKRKILRINTPGGVKVTEKANFLILSLDFNSDYLSRFDTEKILNNEFDPDLKVSLNETVKIKRDSMTINIIPVFVKGYLYQKVGIRGLLI